MQPNEHTKAFSSINHKLSKLPEIVTQCSIYRVHKELRDVNNNAYEPKLIAIGPYHHGKDDLQKMEEHKLHYLQLLLESGEQKLEGYVSAIGELEQKARDCYAEPIHLPGDEFVEMLVLDGCFIIELVRKYFNEDSTCKNDPILQTQWIRGTLVRDLILFENQIPFFVLCKLFDLIEGPNKHHMLIGYLLCFCWGCGVFGPQLKMTYHRSPKDIKHLLDLVYNNWLPSPNDNFWVPSFGPLKAGLKLIPSATKLKDANVKFQKKEEWNTLFDVNFEKGILKMPPLNIEDRTECFLRNFIVYEQYFLEGQRNPVTDYMVLLDCLINSSEDVEILYESEIINNWLDDNETVANIINRLGVSIFFHGRQFVYAEMFDDVNSFYKRPWNRWMVMLKRDIFYSPFAYLSFFAALAILVFTVVQTVCSIRQVV